MPRSHNGIDATYQNSSFSCIIQWKYSNGFQVHRVIVKEVLNG